MIWGENPLFSETSICARVDQLLILRMVIPPRKQPGIPISYLSPNTIDASEIRRDNQLRLVGYPIIYKGF